MSATASRIALSAPESVPGVQGDAPAGSEPSSAATEGTRPLPRRDHGGRFAPPLTFPRCERCGWTLAEDLAAGLYCCDTGCTAYRKVVGIVDGVDVGTVTAAAIEVGT
jgi:hypothetical protein